MWCGRHGGGGHIGFEEMVDVVVTTMVGTSIVDVVGGCGGHSDIGDGVGGCGVAVVLVFGGGVGCHYRCCNGSATRDSGEVVATNYLVDCYQ